MMYLVASYPTDRMPISHSDQEAMAQAQTSYDDGSVAFGGPKVSREATHEDNDIWGQRLVEELVSDLTTTILLLLTGSEESGHAAYWLLCNLWIPNRHSLFVQDMVDMAHNMYPPDKSDITLPSSVNAEYMQANDDEILSFTSQESYWWLDTETIAARSGG